MQNNKAFSISKAPLTVGWEESCPHGIMQQAECRFYCTCQTQGPRAKCGLQDLQRFMIFLRQLTAEASAMCFQNVHRAAWKPPRVSSHQMRFRAQRLAARAATQISGVQRFGLDSDPRQTPMRHVDINCKIQHIVY